MGKKKIEPVEYAKDGTVTFNLYSNAADADWIRAARLKKRAEAGDKEAEKELEELFNTPLYRYEDD